MRIAFVHNLQRNLLVEEAEFDTSEVVNAIAQGLRSGGHEVLPVEMTRDGTWIDELKNTKADLAFNTAEGYFGVGRESYAPTVFDQLKIPFIGSGAYTCFLTLDKNLSKEIVAKAGVPVAPGFLITRLQQLKEAEKTLEYPVFAKPNFEGSSKGISSRNICKNFSDLEALCKELIALYPEGVLVEAFIPGKDFTVPYIEGLGEKGVLEPVEYVFHSNDEIYDFNLKNESDNLVDVRCPAQIDIKSRNKLVLYTRKVVQALGINDFTRVDFRITPDGQIFFVEVNALPSLQPGASLFAATKILGLDYSQTLGAILDTAQKRLKVSEKPYPLHRRRSRKARWALVFNLKRKTKSDSDYEEEAEFDSLETVTAIQNTVTSLGHDIQLIEANADLPRMLKQEEIDIVFNIAEGKNQRSREAQVPAICDLLGIEHTGSDATCLAITLDKFMACRLVPAEGILAPRGLVLDRHLPKKLDLNFPIIAKPNIEGTSKGIYGDSVAKDPADLERVIKRLRENYNGQILLQEYIIGRELTVGVIGTTRPKVLAPLEIEFKKTAGELPVYSFEHKQLNDQYENQYLKMLCPAPLSVEQNAAIKKAALKAFEVLGCRDYARIDFRMTEKNEMYFIEVNPLPGLSPGFSDLAIMAEKQDIEYSKLIAKILQPALRRWRSGSVLNA